MNQESDWKPFGSLANRVLRSVEEKRMKQVEFLTARKGPYEAALPDARENDRLQLALPFAPSAELPVPLSAVKY